MQWSEPDLARVQQGGYIPCLPPMASGNVSYAGLLGGFLTPGIVLKDILGSSIPVTVPLLHFTQLPIGCCSAEVIFFGHTWLDLSYEQISLINTVCDWKASEQRELTALILKNSKGTVIIQERHGGDRGLESS